MDKDLRVNNISMSYGGPSILQNLSLSIAKGSFVGLLGPNGAGKTSLLLAISGQFKPDEGSVIYEGKDIYEHNLWFKQRIGFVHESPFFYSNLTAEDFMRFVAGVKQVPAEKSEDEISGLFNSVLLSEQRNKLISQLSMGMRKKLAIASAFIGSPEIVFLDEALNGIDFESTFHIKEKFRDFVNEGGIAILSSHVLDVVEKLCNRNLILKDGQLIADLSLGELEEMSQKGKSLEMHLMDLLTELK